VTLQRGKLNQVALCNNTLSKKKEAGKIRRNNRKRERLLWKSGQQIRVQRDHKLLAKTHQVKDMIQSRKK
jgi:hypothetical protein